MCFVYHNRVNTQLLKGNEVIFPALIGQGFKLFLQLFLLAFHLLYGPAFPVPLLHIINRIGDLIYLFIKHSLLSLCRNWNFFKLRVRHNDAVIIACRNP